ncbi:MAG: flagellar export chaperone FliS [Geminicoccaceae bacterium]|nr:flagellar export chaperone FliS [Geminicoccaceae bacterium]MCX8100668.1 flagellar export chaperone FliS [Geminicoccaceae bacterium]MDW8371801.1 flagellar export chaperone FliS [Geminicoccaceae bacterium]
MNAHTLQRAAAAYRGAAETIAPAQQLVMLYDGAIRFVREAESAIAAGAIERRHRNVRKAWDIVNALHACLDFERGGEVARSLDLFYGYVLHRLTRIDVTNDPAICAELIRLLGQMRASWAAIASGGTAEPERPRPPLGAASEKAGLALTA